MVKVYFVPVKTEHSLIDMLGTLFDKAFSNLIQEGDFCALKMSFGERGNTAFIRPIYARKVVEKIKERKAFPFLADCNTLYKAKRANSFDHIETAIFNGFSYATIGAPIIICDGLHGHNYKEVEINKPLVKKAKIGSDILEADSIIAFSHFKGHMETGFGGAIKNVGMGCASRAGKQVQHSSVRPKAKKELCIKCRKCAQVCPADAILYKEGFAFIDSNICIGCGECVTVCSTSAIDIEWGSEMGEVQKKMAEYCYAVVHNKRVGYITMLMNITPDCDCFPKSDASIVPDIGILASTDPVAIDQASFDLVNKQLGIKDTRLKDLNAKDKFYDIHGFDSTVQLSHGEEIGLGERKYELIIL